jgi:hypothetical protein
MQHNSTMRGLLEAMIRRIKKCFQNGSAQRRLLSFALYRAITSLPNRFIPRFLAISIHEPLHNYDISRSAINWTNESILSQSSTKSQLSLPTRSFFKSCVATAVNNSRASRLSMLPRTTFSGHYRWRPQLIHPMLTSTANSTRFDCKNRISPCLSSFWLDHSPGSIKVNVSRDRLSHHCLFPDFRKL